MTNKPPRSRWSSRRFVSFLLLFSFLSSLATGLVCYIKPSGRVANWTGWTFLGLGKNGWEDTHITTSVLLLLAACFHFWFNWRPLKMYLKGVFERAKVGKAELFLATALLLVTWVGTLKGWQPFVQLALWSGDIKAWWEAGSDPAPRPHAEDATLETLAGDYGMPLAKLLEKLKAVGYDAKGGNQVLGDLASQYGLSSAEMVRRALGFTVTPRKSRGNDRGAGGGQGTGWGRMTLIDLCRREGLALDFALKVLKERGVTAQGSHRIRDLAGKLGLPPRELADLFRRK